MTTKYQSKGQSFYNFYNLISAAMIKRITKILNNRVLLQKNLRRFSAEDQDNDPALEAQFAEEAAKQIQSGIQNAEEGIGPEVTAEIMEEEETAPNYDEDVFQQVSFFESNWKEIAPLIKTKYHFQAKSPQLKRQVNEQLYKIETLLNLDIRKLEKAKITEHRELDIRSTLYSMPSTYSRVFENSLSPYSQIGTNLVTRKKLKEMIDTENVYGLAKMYSTGQFRYLNIQNDIAKQIIDSVASSNFQNQFLLNLLDFHSLGPKDRKMEIYKNLEIILRNLHKLEHVNKLRFYWNVRRIFENGDQLVDYSYLASELPKISLKGADQLQSQRATKIIYSTVLGREAVRKMIRVSFERYGDDFEQFMVFWGLMNLLLSRLCALNETSLKSPHNLNTVFRLFEFNLQMPKELITQVIPELINESKNRVLFEIYRVHAKYWFQRKPEPQSLTEIGPYDKLLNEKLLSGQSLEVTYNGWTSPYSAQTTVELLISAGKKKTLEPITETKMIEHLIRGDYNFVLNHFLLQNNPGFDKNIYSDVRKVIEEADNYTFTDENAKALYILKNLAEKLIFSSDPVQFRQEFLGSFKKLKMFQKKEQSGFKKLADKMMEAQGHYSRKRSEKIDPSDPDIISNKEKIRSRPKRNPEGALFSKKLKGLFSTSADSYKEYREVVKEVCQISDITFNFDQNIGIDKFKQEVEKKAQMMNEANHKSVLKQNNLPIVGNGANLMKYLFLSKPSTSASLSENIQKRLRVSVVTEIGTLEKDYSSYLRDCRFNFALDSAVYTSLLEEQKTDYVRKVFKTTVSHIIAFRQELTDKEVEFICDICLKNRIGITLLEIYSLLIDNGVKMSVQSIYKMCESLQKFKKINHDLFMLTKKYCEKVGLTFEIKMMSSYVRNLLVEEDEQRLMELCQMIRNQLKPKPYRLNPDLTAEENIKREKEHKAFQKSEYQKILFQIMDMTVLNVSNKLPAFIAQLFDQYQKTQTKLDGQEIALSLIVYCNDVEKFLEIIRSLRAEPQKIINSTYECAIKAMRLNVRGLQPHAQQIFNVTLFTKNFALNEETVEKSVQLFKQLHTPTVFIKFLEFILRYNLPVSYEIKNNMYFVMNNTNDDFAKNTMSGLLDFIYNTNRQKEREQYRKTKIQEEEKIKLLEQIEKKDFFFDKTENQKEKMVRNIEEGKLEEARKPKKNKNPTKEASKEKAKADDKNDLAAKVEKIAKADRRKISLKGAQNVFVEEDTIDPVLKRSNIPRKLRSKSLDNFEEMFAKKQEVEEPAKGKKKGQKK